MKHALVLLALAACQRDNHVELQLGTLDGFSCDDPATGHPLYDRGIVAGSFKFIVYVDVFSFRDTPSCFGEDLVASCNDPGCTLAASKCVEVDVPPPLSLTAVETALNNSGTLFADAPDGTVVVRMIATDDQSCPPEGMRPAVTADNVIGCVHSCPEVLDDISGDLELQLGLLNIAPTSQACEDTVLGCAQLVPKPSSP